MSAGMGDIRLEPDKKAKSREGAMTRRQPRRKHNALNNFVLKSRKR
jgi:hypothetical protein